MALRDTLVAEATSALVIMGLLVVFLPLFLDAVRKSRGGAVPFKRLKVLKYRAWLVPITVGIGGADATTGFVTLWGTADLAKLTAILLLVLIWAVVGLAIVASI